MQAQHDCGMVIREVRLCRARSGLDPLNQGSLPSFMNRRRSSGTAVDPYKKLSALLQQHALSAQCVADNALASFVIINAALQRSAALTDYVMMPALQKRMKNYRVGMGFGLHSGCASFARTSCCASPLYPTAIC